MKKLIAILLLALPGCAANGFWSMSDSWCLDHPYASEARCVKAAP